MTWQSAIFPGSRTSVNVFLYLFVQLKNALSDATEPAFTPGKLSLRAECRVWPKTTWTNKKVGNLCQAPNKIWSLIRLAVTCEVQSLHIIPSVGAAVMLLSFVFLAFCRWYKNNHHLIISSTYTKAQITAYGHRTSLSIHSRVVESSHCRSIVATCITCLAVSGFCLGSLSTL